MKAETNTPKEKYKCSNCGCETRNKCEIHPNSHSTDECYMEHLKTHIVEIKEEPKKEKPKKDKTPTSPPPEKDEKDDDGGIYG